MGNISSYFDINRPQGSLGWGLVTVGATVTVAATLAIAGVCSPLAAVLSALALVILTAMIFGFIAWMASEGQRVLNYYKYPWGDD